MLSAVLGSTPVPSSSPALSGATTLGETPSPAAPSTTEPLAGDTTLGTTPLSSSSPALSGATTLGEPPADSLAGPTRGLTILGRSATAATTDITTLPPGAVFDGRYSVVSTLGVGGMGAVYQAVDTQLNQLVALKALRPEMRKNPQMVDLLRQAVARAQRLNQPHLLTLRHLDSGSR